MPYIDDVTGTNPDHVWRLNGDATDSVGSADGTASGGSWGGTAIVEDETESGDLNTTAGQIALPTSTDIDGALERKAVMGWVEIDSIQLPPKAIWTEGTGDPVFQIVMGMGNNLMAEVVGATNTVQVYGPVLQPGRTYCLFARFEGTNFADEFELYVDGVKQTSSEPADAAPGSVSLPARAAADIGDPGAGSGVGGDSVLLNCPTDVLFQMFATWADADADQGTLTPTIIREELFEKGALPDSTISSGTESAMQTSLDALASTVRPDAPLAIRVEANTGDTDFTLTADDVTFDPRCSIHVQYTGTGTLTWRNDNGGNATIFSTPNGGTVVVQTETSLTVTNLENPTEVRVYEAGTQVEVGGQESVTGGTFQLDLFQDNVDVQLASTGFRIQRIRGVDTSQDVVLQATQILDRNYGNPT